MSFFFTDWFSLWKLCWSNSLTECLWRCAPRGGLWWQSPHFFIAWAFGEEGDFPHGILKNIFAQSCCELGSDTDCALKHAISKACSFRTQSTKGPLLGSCKTTNKCKKIHLGALRNFSAKSLRPRLIFPHEKLHLFSLYFRTIFSFEKSCAN